MPSKAMEWTMEKCNLDDTDKHYVEWKQQPVSEGYILEASIHMTFLERQIYNDGEQISGWKGWTGGARLTTVTEHEGVLRVTELFCNLMVVVPTQIYTCIKVHRIVQQKKYRFYFLS